jgi:uncharacterized membrane protein
MSTSRLEAFSDGVLAIIITVMVLELHVPGKFTVHALLEESGWGLVTYLLSFVYVGIYWNNHHHLFQVCERINGSVLWANLGLLFCLSLFPFTTAWMDDGLRESLTDSAVRTPVIVYGLNLLAAGTAYFVLQHYMAHVPGNEARMRAVFGRTSKEIASIVLYPLGIVFAFVAPWLALVPYVAVACFWLRPDRRVERWLEQQESGRT